MDSIGQYFSPSRNNGTPMVSTEELCSPFRNNRINVPSVPRFSDFLFPQSTENDTVAITQGGEDTISSEGARSKNPVTPGGKGEGEVINMNNSATSTSSSSASASDPVHDDSDETKNPVTPGGKGEGEVINMNNSATSTSSSSSASASDPVHDDSDETKNPVTPGGKGEGEVINMNNSATNTSTSSSSASASDPVHDDSDDSSLPDGDNMHISKKARTTEFSVTSVKNHSTAGSSGSSAILQRTIYECLKPIKPITEVLIPYELDDNTSVVDATDTVLGRHDSIRASLDMNNEQQILARFNGMRQQYQKKVSQPEPVPHKSVIVHSDETHKKSIGKTLKAKDKSVEVHSDETHKKSIGKTLKAKDKKPAVELADDIPYPTGLLNRQEQLLLNKWMKKTRCDEHLMLRNVANTELVYNTFLNIVKVMYQTKCQQYLKKKGKLPFASPEGIWNLRIIFQQWVQSLKEGNSEVGKVSRKNGYTERQVDMLDIGLYVHPLRSTLSQRYRSILENKHLEQYFVGKSWQNIHDKLKVHCKSKPWENLLDFYDMQHEFTKFIAKVTNEEKAKMSL